MSDVYEPHWWRGFVWSWDSAHQCMGASALDRDGDLSCVILFPKSSTRPWTPVRAVDRWKEAVTEVLEPYNTDTYFSVDGVPWEIHTIEDEEAWLAAIEAFEANRV